MVHVRNCQLLTSIVVQIKKNKLDANWERYGVRLITERYGVRLITERYGVRLVIEMYSVRLITERYGVSFITEIPKLLSVN